jgi:two-component system, response regulator / RNA-binding antiterminator
MSPPGAIQNFRGFAALVLHAADQNRAVLERALAQLGVVATVLDPTASEMVPSDLLKGAGILFVDADLGSLPPLSVAGGPPIVAVIGHETPSRLLRVHEIAASAFLIKPLRAQGVFSAIFVAVNGHRRLSGLQDQLGAMASRHAARRHVIKAVIAVMQRHGVDDEEAFRMLRRESMARRITVEELSQHLVESPEQRGRRLIAKG